MIDFDPILLSLRLALITTMVLLFLALPVAYWLSHTKSQFKPLVEALVSMPIVLPPTVLGFYLLFAFSPNNAFGRWLQDTLGVQLVFSFSGLVIASLIYSLPFMVNPIHAGLSALPPTLREASYTLGKGRLVTFLKVLLPNIKGSLLSGIVLTFAHTMGEFGVVMMIGGSIPGSTKVASIAIYEEVELLRYENANMYSLVLIAITFTIVLGLYFYNNRVIKKLIS